jgi:hypothetical protein
MVKKIVVLCGLNEILLHSTIELDGRVRETGCPFRLVSEKEVIGYPVPVCSLPQNAQKSGRGGIQHEGIYALAAKVDLLFRSFPHFQPVDREVVRFDDDKIHLFLCGLYEIKQTELGVLEPGLFSHRQRFREGLSSAES